MVYITRLAEQRSLGMKCHSAEVLFLAASQTAVAQKYQHIPSAHQHITDSISTQH